MSQFIVPLTAATGGDADRIGPKAANLAALGRAGLPTPGGFCVSADAYRAQTAALGLEPLIRRFAAADAAEQRRLSVDIRLGLYEQPIAPAILTPLLAAWHAQRGVSAGPSAVPTAVRSSSLIEDRKGSNFAGQFESFLDIDDEAALVTAVRACWAALWTTNARRGMENHGCSPAETAMAALIQPVVDARVSGGGLSETAAGGMLISATWGLGSTIAQGEVVPDRIVLSRQGFLRKIEAGRKDHRERCGHGATPQAVPTELISAPCLDAAQAVTLGRMMLKAESVIGGPVEIEWALDDAGFKLLQARPLAVEPITIPDEIWRKHPGLSGHPAGVGWGAGRAVVVNCECELTRVAPGDVLVTRIASPALSHVLPRVAGVVAELGGSTSHLASLARERGIPMVLGVLEATSRIPDGSQVAVDGVAGIVRWMA
jgi:pyruvate, water dikinase